MSDMQIMWDNGLTNPNHGLKIFGTHMIILFIIKTEDFWLHDFEWEATQSCLHTSCCGLIDWNCRPVISLHQVPCLYISIMELSFNQKLNAASLSHLLKILELWQLAHTTKIVVLVPANLYKEKRWKGLSASRWPLILLYEDDCLGEFPGIISQDFEYFQVQSVTCWHRPVFLQFFFTKLRYTLSICLKDR